MLSRLRTDSPPDNDGLVHYLARQREHEVNQGMTDIQILRRNRDNWRYIFFMYLIAGYAASMYCLLQKFAWAPCVMVLSIYPAAYIDRYIWKLNSYVELCLTRGMPVQDRTT